MRLPAAIAASVLFLSCAANAQIADVPPPAATTMDEPLESLIGFTQLSTNLSGGRHANVRTMRAMIMRTDGSGSSPIAADLADDPNSWTQFAGWSPDGARAIVLRGWQSPDNARWEEEHKAFRHTKEGWLLDAYLVDLASRAAVNVSAVERVSFYNTVFFWPNDPTSLGLTAIVDGKSKLFRMNQDGRGKTALNEQTPGFAYGLNSSPRGDRIAYHEDYQVYLANADGSRRVHVDTGQPFNFAPMWSPDGTAVLFLAGEHYNCHPYLVDAEGTNLRKLADRGGYRGVVEFLDVFDFHGGSSDTPVWSADGESVLYTALVGDRVELHRVTPAGQVSRLTASAPGTLVYHPRPSVHGPWLLLGRKQQGVRQICLMNLHDNSVRQLTDLPHGTAAMWPHWQPR